MAEIEDLINDLLEEDKTQRSSDTIQPTRPLTNTLNTKAFSLNLSKTESGSNNRVMIVFIGLSSV